MTISLWRIAADRLEWSADDMTGAGAAVTGARWNHPGEHVVYTSTSASLAAWETRVAFGPAGTSLPYKRYLVRIDVPDAIWEARACLAGPQPMGWDAIPAGLVSRNLGSTWLAAGKTVLLAVPSVVVAEEDNVLINPAHADAAQLAAVKLRKFVHDPRL